jgi:hypothetical protein
MGPLFPAYFAFADGFVIPFYASFFHTVTKEPPFA